MDKFIVFNSLQFTTVSEWIDAALKKMDFIVFRKGPIDLKSFVNSGSVEGSDDIQPSILKNMFSVVFSFLKHVGFEV